MGIHTLVQYKINKIPVNTLKMARSVLAQQYQTNNKKVSKQSVRSIYNVENQVSNNRHNNRGRQHAKVKDHRRAHKSIKHKKTEDPEDEELDMDALAEYVEELKEYMHGSGSNSSSNNSGSYINSI